MNENDLAFNELSTDWGSITARGGRVVASAVVDRRWLWGLAPSKKEPKHLADFAHNSADYVHARQDILMFV